MGDGKISPTERVPAYTPKPVGGEQETPRDKQERRNRRARKPSRPPGAEPLDDDQSPSEDDEHEVDIRVSGAGTFQIES